MRHMQTKNGDRLFPWVKVRVFTPGNKQSKLQLVRAGNKKGFTSEGVDHVLDSACTWLEQRWPDQEFRMVQVGPTQYNFVHVGERKVSA